MIYYYLSLCYSCQIYDAKDSIVASLMDYAESEACTNILNALYRKKPAAVVSEADRKAALLSSMKGGKSSSSGGLGGASSDLLSLAKGLGVSASVASRANLLPPLAQRPAAEGDR